MRYADRVADEVPSMVLTYTLPVVNSLHHRETHWMILKNSMNETSVR